MDRMGLGTAVLNLSADQSKLDKTVDRAGRTTKQKLKAIGGEVRKTGTAMTLGLTAPLAGFGVKASQVAGSFESQMNTLTIAARSSGTSLDTLRESAIATGADTRLVGISAAESAEAMENFYKAGLSTADMFGGEGQLNSYLNEGTELSGALRAAIDMAAASELDLAAASDAVTVAMSTYDIPAEEATDITNNFVQAADASVTSVPMLTEALKNAGPVLSSYGISLEDTNNMLAILSERGIEGGEAGTALRSMFTNLQRPTDSVTDALDAANVELYDAQGALKPMPDIIGQFVEGTKNMTEEQRNLTIQQAAGTYGMRALNTLMAEGTEGWHEMADATESAATAQDVAGARTKGFEAAMEALEGTFETFMIKAGTPLIKNVLTPLINRLSGVIGQLAEADPKFFKIGLAVGAVVAAAGPLLFILGSLITLLGGLLSPIGLIAGAVGALVYAFVRANGGIEGTINRFSEFAEWLQTNILPTIQSTLNIIANFFRDKFLFIQLWIKNNMGLIQDTFQTVLPILQQIWQTTLRIMETIIRVFWESVKAIVNIGLTVILGLIKSIMQMIQGDWKGAWNTIRSMVVDVLRYLKSFIAASLNIILAQFDTNLTQVWNTVKRYFNRIYNTVSQFMNRILSSIVTTGTDIRTFWDKHGQRLRQIAKMVWNIIRTGISQSISQIRELIYTNLQQIRTFWSKHGQSIRTAVGQTWNFLRDLIFTRLRNIWNRLKSNLQQIQAFWSSHGEQLKTITRAVWDTILTVIETTLGIIQAVQTAISAAIEGDWKAFGDALKKVWRLAWEGIVSILESNWEALKALLVILRDGVIALTGGTIDGIQSAWESAKESLITVISAPFEAAGEIINSVYNTISGLMETIRGWWDEAQDLLDKIEGALESAEGVLDSISGAVSRAWQKVRSMPSVPGFQAGTPPGGVIFDRPSLIAVGEAGPERVTVEPVGGRRRGGVVHENHYHLTVPQPVGNIGDLRNTLRLLEMATP